MPIVATPVALIISGPLRALDATEEDCTPSGKKAQGLLALLALAPGHRRPRRWVEDKLWSTRGAEQAGASLRQTLSEIRRSFGRGVVEADRTSVWLDPETVRIVTLDDPQADLLEGIDVRDPEFEIWLRQERARHGRGHSALSDGTMLVPSDGFAEIARPARSGISIRGRTVEVGPEAGSDLAAMLGTVMTDRIGQGISEQVSAWLEAARDPSGSGTTADLEVECSFAAHGPASAVLIRVVHGATKRVLFSRLYRIESVIDEIETGAIVSQAAFEATERVLAQLPLAAGVARAENRAAGLMRLALTRTFGFSGPGLVEADRLMAQAHEADPLGVHLAWRAFFRTVQLIERLIPNTVEAREEADTLGRHALDMAGDNPQVLALLAQMRAAVFGDAAGAADLARRAIALNPSNAFGWQAAAIAATMTGEHSEAYRLSSIGRRIAERSQFRHWWDLNHCIVCTATGRHEEAIAAGTSAAMLVPDFRPAQRHLIALHAASGNTRAALKAAATLARAEPDFTLDRMLNDPDYPVRTLRGMGLLERLADALT